MVNPVMVKLLNSKFIGAGWPHEQTGKGANFEDSTGGVQDHLDERMVIRRVILKTLNR